MISLFFLAVFIKTRVESIEVFTVYAVGGSPQSFPKPYREKVMGDLGFPYRISITEEKIGDGLFSTFFENFDILTAVR